MASILELSSFRLVILSFLLQFVSLFQSMLSLSIRQCCRCCRSCHSMPSLDTIRSHPVDEASRCSSFCFSSGSYATIFSSSTNTTFLLRRPPSLLRSAFALLLLLSMLLLLLFMRMLLSPFHARGFSIRVGLGTTCTQYLFRDHFFRFECSYLMRLYRHCCCYRFATSSAITDPSLLLLVILYMD